MQHHSTMKTNAKTYLSNRECSVRGALYHILPELKLRGIFPAVCFVNTNPPEERIQILLSEKELSEIPDDSSYIFKKSNIERSSATLYKGKYSILEDFCYGEFLGCYTIENKSSKTCDYQRDELDDNLIENNH